MVGCGLGLRVVTICSSRSSSTAFALCAVMFLVTVAQLMGYALLHPINVRRVSHEQTAARFVDCAALIWFFHGPIFYLPVDLPGMVF